MCNLMCYKIYHVPYRNASKKSKNFDFGICTYDVSGYSMKEYSQNFKKAMQNLGKSNLITMLQIEANRSKKVE